MEKNFICSRVLAFDSSSFEEIGEVTNFTDEEKEIIISFFTQYFKPWYENNKKIVSPRRPERIKDIWDITFHDCVLYAGLSKIPNEIIHDYIHESAVNLIKNKILEYKKEEISHYTRVFDPVLPKKN